MKNFYVIMLFLCSFVAFAQTEVVNETFPTDGELTANGWTRHSAATDPDKIMIVGGAAQLVAGGKEDANKAFSTPYTAANGYTSKVVYTAQVNVLNSTGLTTSGDYFLHLKLSGTTYIVRVYVKAGTSGYLLGIMGNTGGSPAATPIYATSETPYGTVSNLTVTYEITKDASGGLVSQKSTLQYGSNTVENTLGSPLSATTPIESIALREVGTASSGTGNISIDNITVTTYPPVLLGLEDLEIGKVVSENLIKNTVVRNELHFSKPANVTIFTLEGQLIKTLEVNSTLTVDISDLSSGIYIVVGEVEGKKISEKFVKK